MLTETLQNSRRGGATGARISVGTLTDQPGGETRFTVTIADDGTGIADPAVLLSFGENGWSDDLVRREDAAGFGFASLSRRGCTVASRPRSPDGHTLLGWRVDLAPEHFLGEAEAEVHADDSAPFPHGTSISFEATESAAAIRNAAENAARHYPLPVMFDGIPRTEPGGEQLDRRAFLDGTIHAEPWRGLAFGVFRNRHRGYNDPDLNFFGLTVPLSLPTVESVHGGIWSVRADIGDCPDLELVLPARKEAVENDFLKEMRSAARLAIYCAMAADPEPRPAYADWKRAQRRRHRHGAAAGRPAALASRRRRCRRLARAAEARRSRSRRRWSWTAIRNRPRRRRSGAPPIATASHPACSRPTGGSTGTTGMTGSTGLPASKPGLPLKSPPRSTQRRIGSRSNEFPMPERDGAPPRRRCRRRPRAIRINLAVTPARGPGRTLDLPADLVFAGEAWSWIAEALPLVTADSDLQPHQLAELLRAGFFSPSDDADSDSWETQRDRFDQEASHIAMRLLASDDEARIGSIAEAVRRELFWLVPRDRPVEISICRPEVRVTLHDAAEDTS